MALPASQIGTGGGVLLTGVMGSLTCARETDDRCLMRCQTGSFCELRMSFGERTIRLLPLAVPGLFRSSFTKTVFY